MALTHHHIVQRFIKWWVKAFKPEEANIHINYFNVNIPSEYIYLIPSKVSLKIEGGVVDSQHKLSHNGQIEEKKWLEVLFWF